jgi:hypothetical protein
MLLPMRSTISKLLRLLEPAYGDPIALCTTVMQLTMRTKVTCGFLILAVGMMITDCYRLLRAPSDAVISATGDAQHSRKF